MSRYFLSPTRRLFQMGHFLNILQTLMLWCKAPCHAKIWRQWSNTMRLANNVDHGGSDSDFEQAGDDSGSNLPRIIHRLKLYFGEKFSKRDFSVEELDERTFDLNCITLIKSAIP